MDLVLELAQILVWMALWSLGGWLIAAGLFRLRRGEAEPLGLGLGLVLEVWLANALSHFLPVAAAFWASPALLLGIGIVVTMARRSHVELILRPLNWIGLLCTIGLFFAIGRGLAIFDDYQNLPTISLMAAGDVPPHFALDPSLRFGYHYFLLLFAAQLMLLGNMLPWTALDLARGILLGLPLVLAAMWVYRLTRSRVAAFLGLCTLALAGGSRWLLLLMPATWVDRISSEIMLIGSAASTAPTLAQAMISEWKIDGDGPIPFPFAFYSGINQPYVMLHTGIAGSGILILLILLLTAGRWRNWGAAVVTTLVLAALALANEIAFLLLGLGMLVAAIAWLAVLRRRNGGSAPWSWIGVGAAALMVAALQGGMLTEMMLQWLRVDPAIENYFDTTTRFAWPPSLVSAHLGTLYLGNPSQLVMALLEIGPIVLITPLLMARGWRALSRRRWLEASLIASSLGAILAVLVTFQGPLFTAAPRLLGGWLFSSSLYFVPLLWAWSARRPEWVRVSCLIVAAASCLGGLVLLGVQLPAMQRPVFATFISPLDAKATAERWNTLEPEGIVFDPLVFRAPTVLGRPTRSSPTWYARDPEWERLRDAADPVALRAAGFDYMYIDKEYWDQLTAAQQLGLQDDCVQQIWNADGTKSETDYRKDFRSLLDIRSCQ